MMQRFHRLTIVASVTALAAFCAPAAHAAGFVTIPVQGGPNTTVTQCNLKINLDTPTETQPSGDTDCKLTALPSGTILKSSRTANITVNGVTVGTLYDVVRCAGTGSTCNGTNTYYLLTRLRLNTNAWNPTGNSFEVNDVFRATRSGVSIDSGYLMSATAGSINGNSTSETALAKKYLELTGRTLQGLFEPSGSAQYNFTKVANNGWVDFRSDTNKNDPDANPPYSYSSEWSPWLVVRQNCPTGYNTTPQTFKMRLWEGGEEGQTPQAILTSAYVCN